MQGVKDEIKVTDQQIYDRIQELSHQVAGGKAQYIVKQSAWNQLAGEDFPNAFKVTQILDSTWSEIARRINLRANKTGGKKTAEQIEVEQAAKVAKAAQREAWRKRCLATKPKLVVDIFEDARKMINPEFCEESKTEAKD